MGTFEATRAEERFVDCAIARGQTGNIKLTTMNKAKFFMTVISFGAIDYSFEPTKNGGDATKGNFVALMRMKLLRTKWRPPPSLLNSFTLLADESGTYRACVRDRVCETKELRSSVR